jgi:hypothetical protein
VFNDPNLAINEYLGVDYYVTFPGMNYGCKKGLIWDFTKKHPYESLRYYAI